MASFAVVNLIAHNSADYGSLQISTVETRLRKRKLALSRAQPVPEMAAGCKTITQIGKIISATSTASIAGSFTDRRCPFILASFYGVFRKQEALFFVGKEWSTAARKCAFAPSRLPSSKKPRAKI
jgi:hypothetical protein